MDETAATPNPETGSAVATGESASSLVAPGSSLMDAVHKRFIEQNADVAIQLISERDKLKKAYEKFDKWVKRLETGDVSVIKEYKKKRKQAEEEEDYEF